MTISSPHRRYNPLTDEWVLVSPQRNDRPWHGANEHAKSNALPEYDPACLLCPNNMRSNGDQNEKYTSTYVFENDFPAIFDQNQVSVSENNPLLKAEIVNGACKVMCFSPKHNKTLAQMTPTEIVPVIEAWIQETKALQKQYQTVQIFENKGAVMGCSNPHPHCQIWASDFIPTQLTKEDHNQKIYYENNKTSLLLDYIASEKEENTRVVLENEDWIYITPFWAVWPYEVILLPKRAIKSIIELTEDEITSLSLIMQQMLQKYDKLFETSFPYSMGWHNAPFNDADHSHWQLHAHYYPPLLRSATIKKFMVGYEMLAEAQRDITPEQATETLRNI